MKYFFAPLFLFALAVHEISADRLPVSPGHPSRNLPTPTPICCSAPSALARAFLFFNSEFLPVAARSFYPGATRFIPSQNVTPIAFCHWGPDPSQCPFNPQNPHVSPTPQLHAATCRCALVATLFTLTVSVTSSFAAIAFDSAATKSATNAASVALVATPSRLGHQQRVLIVGLSTEDTSTSVLTVSAITYNGVAMTAVANSGATAGSSTLR